MKRTISVMFSLMALAAFVIAPAVSFAGACEGAKTAQTSDHQMMSAKGQCSAEHAAACAAKMGMPIEECQKLCASGEYTMVNMYVKGMTCTGCESTISACLAQLPGVVKVGMVSYKEGVAHVMIDPKKVRNEDVVKAVSDKGYAAEVIPAVSVTPIGTQIVGDASHPCGAEAAKACAKKCAQPCGTGAKTDKTEKPGTGL